jgi:hypothetical protein
MIDDKSISTLLDMDGNIIEQDYGHWVKIIAHRVEPNEHVPHGIKYSLTLHDKYGTRVLGYDNAHAPPKPKKFKYSGVKFTYDHKHRSSIDKGVPYEFQDAYQLISDFFTDVDEVIKEVKGK